MLWRNIQKEVYIYGSSRLGVKTENLNMFNTGSTSSSNTVSNILGMRSYEVSNHLGNVLSVITDKLIPVANGALIDYYNVEIAQATDYSPFGCELKGRNLKLTGVNKSFRFGFQGQEGDDEIKGDGNSVNYKYRMHDPRLGRFFAVDPLSASYPANSPYAFSENNVINCVELEGLEKIYVYNKYVNGKGQTITKYSHTVIDARLKENINRVDNYNGKGSVETRTYKGIKVGKVVTVSAETRGDFTDHFKHVKDQYEVFNAHDIVKDPMYHEPMIENGPFKEVTVTVYLEVKVPTHTVTFGVQLFEAGGESTNTGQLVSSAEQNKKIDFSVPTIGGAALFEGVIKRGDPNVNNVTPIDLTIPVRGISMGYKKEETGRETLTVGVDFGKKDLNKIFKKKVKEKIVKKT